MPNRFKYRLSIVSVCVCSGIAIFAQQPPAPKDRIVLRLRPAGPDGNKKALEIMADLFDALRVEVAQRTTLEELSLRVCGRIDQAWIAKTRTTNPVIGSGNTIIPQATLDLPPCPYWRRTGSVAVPAIGTLSHRLWNQMGTFGPTTLDQVAKQNKRSKEELTTALHPGDKLELPWATSFSSYKLKADSRRDYSNTMAAIRAIPGYTDSTAQTSLSLIAEADQSNCQPPSDVSKWPFDSEEVRQVLLFNNTKRSGPPLKTVIGIADTGIDRSEQRLFLANNIREIPNNNIDDDENGYVDDFDGVNMNRLAPGFPLLNDGYHAKWHGTHVAGLALGGLQNPQLNDLVKERISVRIMNIIRKTVTPSPGGSSSSWPIPNDLLLNAIEYVGQEPIIPIINMSVESADDSGLNRMLASNQALVVAAAGNDALNLDVEERYPAAVPNRSLVLSVAAHDGLGGLTDFSNWGANRVDLAAPGCQVESIVPIIPGLPTRKKVNGTSQAAPLVSFAAALLYSEGLTIPQIKTRILLTTEYDPAKLGDCPNSCVGSQGRLNIARAVDIFEDVLVVREASTIRTLHGRIQDDCLIIDGGCVPIRTQLKRVLRSQTGSRGTCWRGSRNNQINSGACSIESTSFQFQTRGKDHADTIDVGDLIDLVPAVR